MVRVTFSNWKEVARKKLRSELRSKYSVIGLRSKNTARVSKRKRFENTTCVFWRPAFSDDCVFLQLRLQQLANNDQVEQQANQVEAPAAPTYDVWCMIYDVWCMIYDIWYLIYHIWYIIYDILYIVYDIWCLIYDIWYQFSQSLNFQKSTQELVNWDSWTSSIPWRPPFYANLSKFKVFP